MRVGAGVVVCGSLLLTGCHSRYVQTTVINASGSALHEVQVAYPSASFGTQDLLPGQVFHYRFKVIGSGPVKLDYLDSKMQEHQQSGPVLHEGDEGTMLIRFPEQAHADFQLGVHGR